MDKKLCEYCGHTMQTQNHKTLIGEFCDNDCFERYVNRPTRKELEEKLHKAKALNKELIEALDGVLFYEGTPTEQQKRFDNAFLVLAKAKEGLN